ncbi:hypothetical protein [Azospirillum isscasi]|uniref:Uncharacterized protein n=1 Tax=Azospirillum isscasi TaxID=3053926 RepID=A0ABU0WPB3_9PROT|nr:hypothetical protein [Azospirillum isscasi]MDQ2104649.1 hypothetical protein [Azospirillum isscasi]
MADIEFVLGELIALETMIPTVEGTPTDLPNGISGNHNGGVYIILNTYPYTVNTQNPLNPNRYMGVTTDFQSRFGQRQAACFELGLERQVLDGVGAFLGTVRYRNYGDVNWQDHDGYNSNNNELIVELDGNEYDIEHIFIKSSHEIFGGTITNTNKIDALTNVGDYPLDIYISWQNNNMQQIRNCVIQPGGQIV